MAPTATHAVRRPVSTVPLEAVERFACLGTTCAVSITGDAGTVRAADAARAARRRLESLHSRFSRFLPESELSRVNRDPAPAVPVSAEMGALAAAIAAAGAITGGLVDGTLLAEIEAAGYTESLGAGGTSAGDWPAAGAAAGETRSAGPSARRGWAQIRVDRAADGTVHLIRPPGLGLDGGGIAKGLFADLIGAELAGHAAWAVDLGGDLRIGGTAGWLRSVRVADPSGELVHTVAMTAGAAATSGVSRRRFTGADGRPAHHLLDPATGRPVRTGIEQATAFAATGVLAEVLAKAALLSGADGASRWLTGGGVLIADDGTTTLYGDR